MSLVTPQAVATSSMEVSPNPVEAKARAAPVEDGGAPFGSGQQLALDLYTRQYIPRS